MSPETASPKTGVPLLQNRRALLIGGAIALAMVCLCCALAAGILLLDPFGWNLLGFLFGRGDPLAASMPPDTAYYISVDLSALTDQKLERVVQPFLDATDSTEEIDLERLKEEIDKGLLSSIDLSFKEDIEPWFGPHIGIGLKNLTTAGIASMDSPSFLVALESRNNGKADAFLEKLTGQWEGEPSGQTREYGGVTVYVNQPQYGEPTALARSGDIVLIANSIEDVEKAIDAQAGESLADLAGYRQAIGALPSGRLLTFYMDYAQIMDSYMDTYSGMLNSMPGTDFPIDPGLWQTDQFRDLMEESVDQIGGMAMSLSIVDAGIRMDAVVTMNSDSDAANRALRSKSKPAVDVIKMLPGETFFFVASSMPSEGWTSIREQLVSLGGLSASDYDEAMSALEAQIGVNPQTDLFPYLDGELAVALIASPEGFVADSANADLGALAILETNDGPAMLDTVGKLDSLFAERDLPFERNQSGGMTYYLVTDPLSDEDVLAIGVDGDYLLAGSSAQDLINLRSRKTTLVSNPVYQQAVRALPSGMSALMYLDIQAMMDVIGSSMTGYSANSFDETSKALTPLLSLIVGADYRSSTVGRSSMVLVLAPVE